MTTTATMRPFFLLLGRASVFWLGAFALFCVSIIVAGMADPDARLGLYVDATFIATLWFPAAAGWLAGLVIQEFQHTSFAHHLPGVRSRIATGYVGTGLVVALVVTGVITQVSSTSLGLPLTFVLALGAFCVAGGLQDPLSHWITFTNTLLVVLSLVMSRDLARFAGDHPWIAATVWVVIGAASLRRLFARSTFRRKPFRLTKPLPGRFSFEKSQRYERRRRLEDRSKASGWRAGYLGSDTWAWVRAAHHETHGGVGWKGLLKGVGRLWGLGLLLTAHTWIDRGEMSFVEALPRALFDALFRSPHESPFGEKGGLYFIVVIVISVIGVMTVLFNAVALGETMPYPLSRLQRARVTFRAGLVDVAIFLLFMGLGLYASGHLMGLLAGYEARFDFMPHYFRVVMATLVLLPLVHWGRFQLRAAARRKAEYTIVAVVCSVIGFVVAVATCVYLSPLIFASPIVELSVLVAALLLSQLTYRHLLKDHYRTADLA